MAITTVLAFWTDQKTTADKDLTDAQTNVKNAQTDLATQRDELSKANQELADLAKQTAQVRAGLAEAATPADVDALETRLAEAIINTRSKQAKIIAIEAAIDAAKTKLDLGNASVAAATSRASTVAAALKTADQQDRDRAKLRANLSNPPLKTIVDDAIDALTGKDSLAAKLWTDAKSRIGEDIPKELHDCANERAEVELKRVTNGKKKAAEIVNLLGTQIAERAKVEVARLESDEMKVTAIVELLGTLGADPDYLRPSFDAADAAFRDYVTNAKSWFDQALVIAARIADRKQNPLTAAETLNIHSQKPEPDRTVDAALQTKRNDAAQARLEVATAEIDVDANQTKVDIEVLKAKTKGIEDPDTDATVKAAETTLKSSQDHLETKKKALTIAKKAVLDDWETAVPDTTWRNLADFKSAQQLLTKVKEPDPNSLIAEMDQAEAALVAALLSAEKARRTSDFLASEALRAASQVRTDSGSLPRRMLGALRGDSYDK